MTELFFTGDPLRAPPKVMPFIEDQKVIDVNNTKPKYGRLVDLERIHKMTKKEMSDVLLYICGIKCAASLMKKSLIANITSETSIKKIVHNNELIRVRGGVFVEEEKPKKALGGTAKKRVVRKEIQTKDETKDLLKNKKKKGRPKKDIENQIDKKKP